MLAFRRGNLVAYWFVTTVNDPTCVFCVNIANRVLITRSNAFTNPDDVGNPHTGSDPSWLSNNQLLISGGGAADQWYYAIGTPEAVEWWGDFDNCSGVCAPDPPVGLNDCEVTRDASKIVLVRGDSGETLVIYKNNGVPPAKPTPECLFGGPTGSSRVRPGRKPGPRSRGRSVTGSGARRTSASAHRAARARRR